MANILIIDDSAVIRIELKKIMEDAGHKVVGTGSNGREAVVLFEKLKPDLMTLDLLMDASPEPVKPGARFGPEQTDGLVALRKIREKDPAARVLVITSLAQKPVQDAAWRLGARAVLVKPFGQEQVIDAVRKALLF